MQIAARSSILLLCLALLGACNGGSSDTSGVSPALPPAPSPAKPSYYDEKGLPSGTSLFGQSPDGSGSVGTEISRAISVQSARVTYSTDVTTSPVDSIFVNLVMSNHVGKIVTLIEVRISIFDESGKLLTKRIIKTDEDERGKSKDGLGKYMFMPKNSSNIIMLQANYFSDLSLASNPFIITIGDSLPLREFDEVAQVIRRNGIRIRVEPLQLTFEDGTILTGTR
jgi:hypothetical protein